MSTYGSFEAIEEIFPGRAGSILLARSTQTADSAKFAVKTFKPPVSVLGANAAEQSLKRFLVRAQLQQNLGELPGSMWAPILETGRADSEGYYVTRHYPRSIQALIGGGVRLPAKGLHAVITGVVIGLEQIRKLASRSHGNLKPGNILIDGRGLIQPRNIALADPASDNIATAGGDAADLAAIGQLIHQIITGRDVYTGADWSPQGASEWAHLGPRADQWRDFCRRLVEGNEDSLTMETIGAELRKLRPPSKSIKLIPKIAAVLAITAVAAFFTVDKTRKYQSELIEYRADADEMKQAWDLFFPPNSPKVATPEAVSTFHDDCNRHEAYPDQTVVFPLISQSSANLTKSLKRAKDGTFSLLLRNAEKQLRDDGLSIIADGYQKFRQQLRPASHQTRGLLYAVNIALMEHEKKFDSDIVAAANSVDPGILNSLQKLWIKQLNAVADGTANAGQAEICAKDLKKLKFDAAKPPADKAGVRIKELSGAALAAADSPNENLNTLVNAWQLSLAKWNATDHPEPSPPPVTPQPAAQDLHKAEFAKYKSDVQRSAENYPEIQKQIWMAGWNAANSGDPSPETLKKKVNALRNLIDQIDPPAIEVPVGFDSLSDAVKNTYEQSAEQIYVNRFKKFDESQLPWAEPSSDANGKVRNALKEANQNVQELSEHVNALFKKTSDFNDLISSGDDKNTLEKIGSELLKDPFIQSDKTLHLQALWDGHLKTLTARITNLPGDPAERWKMFTGPYDPPVARETRLALLRTGIKVFENPDDLDRFFKTCGSLRDDFQLQSSPVVAAEIDNLVWQSWQAVFTSVCSKPDDQQLTEKIRTLKAAIPKGRTALSPDAAYNLALADLKQAAASARDLKTLKDTVATSPIAKLDKLAEVQRLLNPKSKSKFTGPGLEKLDEASSDNEKIFTISPTDKDSPDSIQLKFERLHSPLDSTLLLSSEMSFKVCQMLARACEKTEPGSWQALVYKNSQSPFPFWKYVNDDSPSSDPSKMSQAVGPPTGLWIDYYNGLTQRFARKPDLPMNFISPAAAQTIAAVIHCRLPTQDEWKLAVDEDNTDAPESRAVANNLRGAKWYQELELIDAFYGEALKTNRPDALDDAFPCLDQHAFFASGAAPDWNDALVKQQLALKKRSRGDNNPLFFREVGKQLDDKHKFSDLIGNVAEFVNIKASGSEPAYAVVGGSAISPPEIEPKKVYPLILTGDLTNKTAAYSDVGFRLAYDDPVPAPPKDIQDAISRLKYIPVNFSAVSAPPLIGRK